MDASHLGQTLHGMIGVAMVMEKGLVTRMLVHSLLVNIEMAIYIAMTLVDSVTVVKRATALTIYIVVAPRAMYTSNQ